MDYGYANARIRGMKSRLMDRKALEGLINIPDIDSLIIELENTQYKDDIQDAMTKYRGIDCVEYALRKNFTRTFKKILGFVEDQVAEKYIKIFLDRWDIQNIKTILRGKNIHATPEEMIECLMPAGELDEKTLIELIKQPDIKSVIDVMATWDVEYSRVLTKKFREYQNDKDLIVLENALDRHYYESSLKKVCGASYDETVIKSILSTEIDIVNIKTVMRMIRDRIEPEDAVKFLIEGGKRLRIEKLNQMLETKSLKGALDLLADTSYRPVADIPEEYLKKEKISVIEKKLDRLLIKNGISAFSYDPLSIAISIGYFWAKFNEITNIRIISRYKTSDLPEEWLKEELIYV
jgi:V/A-type H+-transporting ATPase subunit C